MRARQSGDVVKYFIEERHGKFVLLGKKGGKLVLQQREGEPFFLFFFFFDQNMNLFLRYS